MPRGTVTFKASVTRSARVVAGSVKGRPTFWLELDGVRQLRAYRTAENAEAAAKSRLGIAA